MNRRDYLGLTTSALAAASLSPDAAAQAPATPVQRHGRLKQSVTRGVFGRGMAFEDTCREAARLGCKGYDLIGPADWPVLKKYGLTPAMYPPGPGGTIAEALNRKENHERLGIIVDEYGEVQGERRAEYHHVLRQPQGHGRPRRRR